MPIQRTEEQKVYHRNWMKADRDKRAEESRPTLWAAGDPGALVVTARASCPVVDPFDLDERAAVEYAPVRARRGRRPGEVQKAAVIDPDHDPAWIPPKLVGAEAVAVSMEFIESCRVPIGAGDREGHLFRLAKFQVKFLRDLLDPAVFIACLFCGRKNAKSATIALLLLSFLVGPLNRQNWRAAVVSISGWHAKQLRQQVMEIARATGIRGLVEYRSPTPGAVIGLNDARVDFLATDSGSTGHAASLDLVIVDETGKLPATARELINGVTGCAGRAERKDRASVRAWVMAFSPCRLWKWQRNRPQREA